MSSSLTFTSSSPEETLAIGKKIASLLSLGDVLCLTGDLGAGKTTLVKGLVEEVTKKTLQEEVVSPTFTYLNIYPGTTTVYHFDLYRLSEPEEFFYAGFGETLEAEGIFCIEWPDRLPSSLACNKHSLHIEYQEQNKRRITLRKEL